MHSVSAADFRVGAILIESADILARNAAAFALLALIVYSPLIVLSLMPLPFDPAMPVRTKLLILAAPYAVAIVLPWILAAAVAYATHETLETRRLSIWRCVRVGLGHVVTGLGVALMVALSAGLGLVLLTMFWVAIPVAVVERTGVRASLSRSIQLTRGYRWRICAVLVIVFVLNLGLGLALRVAFGDSLLPLLPSDGWSLGDTVRTSVCMLVITLGAIATGVGYHRLRRLKEGGVA